MGAGAPNAVIWGPKRSCGAHRAHLGLAVQRGDAYSSVEIVAIAHGTPWWKLVDPAPVDLDAPGAATCPLAQRRAARRRGGLEQHLGIVGIGIIVKLALDERGHSADRQPSESSILGA